jgi:5-formyltetrahydrofolate cyclo-ligase
MSSAFPPSLKSALRKAALARRAALTPEQRAEAAALAARIFPVPITPGTIVAGYHPIRGEFDPRPLMVRLASEGADLALPVVVARDLPLKFRAYSPGASLVDGWGGTQEPPQSASELLPDILLVPLAAFDPAGHRIGYGAGHYDRSFEELRKLKPIITVGLAFDVQAVDAVPYEVHDVALDYVLTETTLFDFRS